jgi:Na+/phosphate symporter
VLKKVLFFIGVIIAALIHSLLAAGALTVAGYLAGLSAGPLVVLFASTFTATFGSTITLACMAAGLFFRDSS